MKKLVVKDKRLKKILDKGGRKGAPDEQRPVTLFSAAIIVIANMIGIGVFTTLGFQVASLHSPFAVLMLWVLGALGAFCGALCYGELGSMMPRSGQISWARWNMLKCSVSFGVKLYSRCVSPLSFFCPSSAGGD